MKKQFEVIDHTADIGITAYGGNLGELMANAACGMVSLMTDSSRIDKRIDKTIELLEIDTVALLVKWLSELLYEFDVERLLFRDFNIIMHGETGLTVTCSGEKFDPVKHKLIREIKATTYHNLNIVKENGVYSASIIFDI